MQKYLDADEKLSTVCLKIDYYDTMLVYIESILKQITNRTYQIKKRNRVHEIQCRTRMMDDFTLESEDFENLPYVELQLDVNDVHLIYR